MAYISVLVSDLLDTFDILEGSGRLDQGHDEVMLFSQTLTWQILTSCIYPRWHNEVIPMPYFLHTYYQSKNKSYDN